MMNSGEFKKARQSLGLTLAELGAILDTDPRTIRKWEADSRASTSRGPNPVACQAVSWMLSGYRPPEWPGEPLCPFCGHPRYEDEESAAIFGMRTGHNFAMACRNCEASSPGAATMDGAIANWRQRGTPL